MEARRLKANMAKTPAYVPPAAVRALPNWKDSGRRPEMTTPSITPPEKAKRKPSVSPRGLPKSKMINPPMPVPNIPARVPTQLTSST
jgi:hypothetical protein